MQFTKLKLVHLQTYDMTQVRLKTAPGLNETIMIIIKHFLTKS